MKLRALLILIGLMFMQTVFAEDVQPPSASTYHNIAYEDCTKMYNKDKIELFYLAIGAVNANKYNLEEIQTQNGYIIFSTGKNKYLITVAGVDESNSIVKITPCNNLYYFQPSILSNIYNYIDSNKDTAAE